MKRTIILLCVFGLIGAALIGPAGAKKKPRKVKRVVTFTYKAGSLGMPDDFGFCASVFVPDHTACANIATGTNDKFVSVQVTDSTGLNSYGALSQDTDGDSLHNIFADFCGKTPKPIGILPGLELRVNLYAVTVQKCLGAATAGTVTVTFTNRR